MILKKFNKLVLDKFSAMLEKHGFILTRERIERHFCEIIYVNKMLYITFMANINYRDYPPYFNILLGEGPIEWPDYDWNHIALWALSRHVEKKGAIAEYSLKSIFELEDTLEKARKDLLKYGLNFLKGDLDDFYKIRKEINEKREPYKIYTPDKKGVYPERYDEASTRLKKKYS